MRQADYKEIRFNVWLGISQIGNGLFQMLARSDIPKREMAARQLCEASLSKFQGLMLFDANSMPANQDALDASIRGAILALGPLTYNAARAGHQDTRRTAQELIADRIVEQLAAYELLVNEPSENIFSDRVRHKRP